MEKLRTVFCCMGILFVLKSYTQQLPPLGTLPMYYNGGFAGEGGTARLNLAASAVWSSANHTHETGAFFYSSFDSFIPKIKTGVGISGGFHPEGSKNGSSGILSVALSPKFSYKDKITIAPFVDFVLVENKESSLDELYGGLVAEKLGSKGRAGILLNTRKLYVGVTLDVYAQRLEKSYEFIGSGTKPFNSIFQFGYIYQKTPISNFSFTPQLVTQFSYNEKGTFSYDVMDFSLMGRYKKILFGFNSAGVGLGYQNNRMKILLSQWVDKNFYSGGLSFRYLFNTIATPQFN